jgi:hypothetical protein
MLNKKITQLITSALGSLIVFSNSYAVAINNSALLQLNADMTLNHDGIPLGVPTGYDWAKHPRLGKGNKPPRGYLAMTGWGQVFWNAGVSVTQQQLQIRNFQTFICNSTNHTWALVQSGDIAGAQYIADFSNNTSSPASIFNKNNNVYTIAFQHGNYAFHFWPKQGRIPIPSETTCGYVITLEAKAISTDLMNTNITGNFLIGLGGDYWATTTATWNHYQTNKDIAIGKLKVIGKDWATFGVSTADDADLNNLYNNGYIQ